MRMTSSHFVGICVASGGGSWGVCFHTVIVSCKYLLCVCTVNDGWCRPGCVVSYGSSERTKCHFCLKLQRFSH